MKDLGRGSTSSQTQSEEGKKHSCDNSFGSNATSWQTHTTLQGTREWRWTALMFPCAVWPLGLGYRSTHTAGPTAHSSAHASLLSHSRQIQQAAHKCHTESQRGCEAWDLLPGQRSTWRPFFHGDQSHCQSSSREGGDPDTRHEVKQRNYMRWWRC